MACLLPTTSRFVVALLIPASLAPIQVILPESDMVTAGRVSVLSIFTSFSHLDLLSGFGKT